MRPRILFPALFFILFSFSRGLWADTIYLKNGNTVRGTIEKENENEVQVHMGFGIMAFSRAEIAKIEKSDATEKQKIWDEWGEERKEAKLAAPEEEEKLKARRVLIQQQIEEELQRKKDKDEYVPKEIKVSVDANSSIYVNVLLNGKVRARLHLDSGASSISLSKRLAGKLGIELGTLEKSAVQVADGRTVEVAVTRLESLKVQNIEATRAEDPGVEAQNIEASFILEDTSLVLEGADKVISNDGLLGMSFLEKFEFTADSKNSKVVFKKIKSENPSS